MDEKMTESGPFSSQFIWGPTFGNSNAVTHNYVCQTDVTKKRTHVVARQFSWLSDKKASKSNVEVQTKIYRPMEEKGTSGNFKHRVPTDMVQAVKLRWRENKPGNIRYYAIQIM